MKRENLQDVFYAQQILKSHRDFLKIQYSMSEKKYSDAKKSDEKIEEVDMYIAKIGNDVLQSIREVYCEKPKVKTKKIVEE